MFWFLFKFLYLLMFICYNYAKAACLFNRNRNRCQCHISFACLVEIKHNLIIHLIYVVPAKYKYIFWIIELHITHILENRISSTCIPFTACTLFIRRKNRYTANIPVQIPRYTNTYMRIQT